MRKISFDVLSRTYLTLFMCVLLLFLSGCKKTDNICGNETLLGDKQNTTYEDISVKAETDVRYKWIKAFIDADVETCVGLVISVPEEYYDERCGLYKTWYESFNDIELGDYSVTETHNYIDFEFEVIGRNHVFEEGSYHYKVTEGTVAAVYWERIDTENIDESYSQAVSLVNVISPYCEEFNIHSDLTDISSNGVFYAVYYASKNNLNENGSITAETLKNGANVLFGIPNYTPLDTTAVLENGCYSPANRGGCNVMMDVLSIKQIDYKTTVDVQFYADPMKTIKSLLVRFSLVENDTIYKYSFENVEVLSEGEHSPLVWYT